MKEIRSANPRRTILGLVVALAVSATATAAAAASDPITAAARSAAPLPVVFVHGNGDSKAIWTTVLWRFESNGYPRDRLFAIDLRNPAARSVDAIPQEGRSSTEEVKDQLASFVQDVLAKTGAGKVALVGNSRGANTIRNYVKNGGGAAYVAKVVLGGGVNHGVVDSTVILVGSEFNGASAFLQQLNGGPSEVVQGVPFLTIRSDRYDKFAQPDGKYLGAPGFPTGVSYDAPELKGASNLVVPGIDHRETSFAPIPFALTYTFVTGRAPSTLQVKPQAVSVLDGAITGITAGSYDNIGVEGAVLSIYAVKRTTRSGLGPAVHHVTTGADGRWGPFQAEPQTFYEFVVDVPGQPRTHIYRSPFPRGSSLVTLHAALLPVARPENGSVVTMIRPRGYFDYYRDKARLNGGLPDGLPADQVPSVNALTLQVPFGPQRSVAAEFNRERIVVRTWPEGKQSLAEFHY